jgi:hypothetical protein
MAIKTPALAQLRMLYLRSDSTREPYYRRVTPDPKNPCLGLLRHLVKYTLGTCLLQRDRESYRALKQHAVERWLDLAGETPDPATLKAAAVAVNYWEANPPPPAPGEQLLFAEIDAVT